MLGPDHTPLSKRHGATSVREFRDRGYLPEALVNYLALLGWSPGGGEELLSLDELARRFSLEAVGHSAGVFDPEKLAWINRHYMKVADPSRLVRDTARYFRARGFLRGDDPAGLAYLGDAMAMAAGSVDRLEEIPERVRFLFEHDPAAALARPEVRDVLEAPGALDVVAALAAALAETPRLADREAFRAAAARVRSRTGAQGARPVPPDPRGPDRRGRRARAGPGRPGHRARRGAAAVGRPRADSGVPRAGGGFRPRAPDGVTR